LTSGARIGKLEPSALDAEQRSLYDAIAGGRRAQGPQLFRLADAEGRLEGPFNAFLLQPRLGSALQALGASVRYDTGLGDRCREIAILVVAAHWRSDFEWYAHEAVGRAAGLGDAELAALREGRHAELAGSDSVIARTAAALVARATWTTPSTPKPSATSARPGCSSCSPSSATTRRSRCSSASSASPLPMALLPMALLPIALRPGVPPHQLDTTPADGRR
jgi:4-carboxymuconolactone decarboxylase